MSSKRARTPYNSTPRKSPVKKVKKSPNYCTTRRKYTPQTLAEARRWTETVRKDDVAWIVVNSPNTDKLEVKGWDKIISHSVLVMDSSKCKALGSPCAVYVFDLECNRCTSEFFTGTPLEEQHYRGKTWMDAMLANDLRSKTARSIFKYVLVAYLKARVEWGLLQKSGSDGDTFLYQPRIGLYSFLRLTQEDKQTIVDETLDLLRTTIPNEDIQSNVFLMFEMLLDEQNEARFYRFTYDPALECAVEVDCNTRNAELQRVLLTRDQFANLRKREVKHWSQDLRNAFHLGSPLQ